MIHKQILIILSVTLLIATSCKTSQKASVVEYKSEDQRYNAVVNSYKDWSTLSTGGKVAIAGEQSFSSSMQLRMVKGKSISISIRPLLGIEMARIFITADSIYIIDKYHKMYVAEKITNFTQGLPLDINLLQDAFLNRVFIIGRGELTHSMHNMVEIKETGTQTWDIVPKNQLPEFIYSFAMNLSNNLTALNIMPEESQLPYSITYEDFKTTDIGTLASVVAITASQGTRSFSLKLNIDTSKIRLGETFNDSFDINPNYKRISASSLSSILKNL